MTIDDYLALHLFHVIAFSCFSFLLFRHCLLSLVGGRETFSGRKQYIQDGHNAIQNRCVIFVMCCLKLLVHRCDDEKWTFASLHTNLPVTWINMLDTVW